MTRSRHFSLKSTGYPGSGAWAADTDQSLLNQYSMNVNLTKCWSSKGVQSLLIPDQSGWEQSGSWLQWPKQGVLQSQVEGLPGVQSLGLLHRGSGLHHLRLPLPQPHQYGWLCHHLLSEAGAALLTGDHLGSCFSRARVLQDSPQILRQRLLAQCPECDHPHLVGHISSNDQNMLPWQYGLVSLLLYPGPEVWRGKSLALKPQWNSSHYWQPWQMLAWDQQPPSSNDQTLAT